MMRIDKALVAMFKVVVEEEEGLLKKEKTY